MTLGNIGWAYLGIQLLIGQATTFACHDVWQQQTSGVDASLRGLSVVDENTIWASGSAGTVLRSVDAGQHWRNVAVAEASELDFRDIHAFDAEHAVVISAGQPARIFRTAGEAGFAASGTNMRVVGDAVFIALGGAAPPDRKPNSRLVYSPDRGLSSPRSTDHCHLRGSQRHRYFTRLWQNVVRRQ